MLKSLLVKDYALIENINVEFGKGLNIITGETGAGKSILIDAMGLLLGERASTEVVRKGSAKSIVEGVFGVKENKKIKNLFNENELDYLPELIVRREISLKGNNRCFVNDTPASLNTVKELGDLLVDLHGQHQHQSLLKTDTHIDFLDEFGNINPLLQEYKTHYKKLNNLKKELKELKEKEDSLKEKKELYSFQIKEIDDVSPEPGEEEKLEEELNIQENAERLLELTTSVYNRLYESENSVNDLLGEIKDDINELINIDKSFDEIKDEFESALTLIKDISESIRSYSTNIEIDPEQIEELRERAGSLNMLKKKYGGSIKAIIEYRKKIGKEFNLAENYSDSIKNIEEQIAGVRTNCGEIALKISEKRNTIAKKVKMEVEEVLTYLGIPNSKFEVKINQSEPDEISNDFVIVDRKKYKSSSKGVDEVEFFISTNPGEDVKPLAKVASGGEISRIMLALKTILAKNDKLPLLIFDEIDVGVSGRVAQKVGQTLKSLSQYHQIISITHLPQIAGLADHHYSVEKGLANERVVSSIKKLSDEERVKEVAKLMSGEELTEASMKGAKELMGLTGSS